MASLTKITSFRARLFACPCCALLAGVLLAHATFAMSQGTADAPQPSFGISSFAIDGNTLLSPGEIERAVAGFVGTKKDFGDIQRALESLEQVYRERGYGVVQVLLPEQDITRGVVRFRVIEPRVGKVLVEGNQNFDTANVLASLPVLRPGATPNSRHVARNLQMLAEHPTKQTTVLLRSGATDNEVDVTVKVTDEKPLKFVATLDNSGTTDTGRFRTGIALQHSNLFNRDHTLNLQYVTSPENPSKVTIYGGGYRVPLYGLSSSLDFFAGYSDVNSGTLQGLFNVSGSGTIMGARYSLYLPKLGEYEQKLAFGLDYRAFKNEVILAGVSLVPDITVSPTSIAYNGLWRMSNAEFGFYASYAQNLFAGGNDGADINFKASRAEATSNYRIWRAGVNYTHVFAKKWQVRAVVNGQYSDDALISGEQFGFGGPDSVRGFSIREVAGDKGYSASLEVYAPEMGVKFGWKDAKARLLAFYDAGTTGRNSIQPGESFGQSGGSVGVGARVSAGKNLSLRVDWAQVIDAAGNQAKGDQMLNATLAIQF